MQNPDISVVMPVYNAAPFLREAIDSVLTQHNTHFEFIIINDGSTDDSKFIILSYNDPRIVYLENEVNSGLVFTLNKGIAAARGKWIARIDGDDIALPARLEKQLAFFSENPEARVLATTIVLVNEKNEITGEWKDDVQHTTPGEIRRFLPFNNCIAHPTIMIDAGLIQQYRYDPSQKLSEDYDLWLRLTADGHTIYKLKEPLLRHRILSTSFTRTTGKNLFFKLMKVKWRFGVRQLMKGNINGFVIKTMLLSVWDGIKGTGKQVKNMLRK